VYVEVDWFHFDAARLDVEGKKLGPVESCVEVGSIPEVANGMYRYLSDRF
jgi:hypothetical protein